MFAADRLAWRGGKDAVEYHAWSRTFHIVMRVRDLEFWESASVKEQLAEALRFMSGDLDYRLTYQPGHATPPSGLFDRPDCILEPGHPTSVLLFSGGLDSLAGALERLRSSTDHVCLVSHQSQPGTIGTQIRLAAALERSDRGRILPYRFQCSLKGERATEETQRTRAFLYTAIAFAVSHALSQDRFYVHENGVTAVNWPKRQDSMNARASRTAHPKVLTLLQDLFSFVSERPICIEAPLLWKTKTDVFAMVRALRGTDLARSTVSCSRTFRVPKDFTHCGLCSQCVDRRFAAYAAGMDDVDDGLYAKDFVRDSFPDGESRTRAMDYVRQACYFAAWGEDEFYSEVLNELADLDGYVPGMDEFGLTRTLHATCRRHGEQVVGAIRRMRELYDDPRAHLPAGSLLPMVNEREHLKEPVQRLVDAIRMRLSTAIPIAFQHNPPANEADLNDKMSAILRTEGERWEREHPAVRFGLAHAVPDHSLEAHDLLIESKYVRAKTTPSKASEGISGDLVKYPSECHVLFVVYDPGRAIVDDDRFRQYLESKRACTVCVVR